MTSLARRAFRRLVTWQDHLLGIRSRFYTLDSDAWSEPLQVTTERDADNRAVVLDEAGAAVAYFHRTNALSEDAEQKCELESGAWQPPQTLTPAEADGAQFTVTGDGTSLLVTPLHPREGEGAPPAFVRPRCDGY